jgi:hypothetical protein
MVFSCGSWHYAAATQRRTHCFGVGWTNTWWLSANRLTSQSSTVEDGPVETLRPASISDELIGSEGVIASLIKDAFHELLTTII